jgi:hypothetical protein
MNRREFSRLSTRGAMATTLPLDAARLAVGLAKPALADKSSATQRGVWFTEAR